MTLNEKKTINEKQVKATTFGLKAIEEIMHQFLSGTTHEEVGAFIVANIGRIVEVTSLACE